MPKSSEKARGTWLTYFRSPCAVARINRPPAPARGSPVNVGHHQQMNPAAYTSDAICQAMGLGSFVDASWSRAVKPTLRVVLTPAFHPELCLTLGEDGDAVYLSVVALAEQFWTHPEELYRAAHRDRTSMPRNLLAELVGLFEAAHAASDPNRHAVSLDGMGVESCVVSSAGEKRLRAHVSSLSQLRGFVARLLQVSWAECRDARVRNAIARTAGYVGIDLPAQDVSAERPVTKVLVLGTREERHDYLAALESKTKRKGQESV